jgi:transposase
VLDVVAELDLGSFYANLREDGRGGASYDPAVILAVLLYAYCVGERSSRRIERRLVEDVAFRVVGANQQPDHATLARFRARHEQAIAGLFAQVLGLCVSEGLVQTGVVSIDSTKVEANASAWSNRTRQQIAEEILAEAERVDTAEDDQFGERRGGELPERWARRRDRRPRLAEALRQLEEQGASDWEGYQADRAAREKAAGRRLPGRKPRPQSKKAKRRHASTTDPDSRMLRARNRFLQGYNAQAAMSEDQMIVASELTNAANDSTMFAPLVQATEANLAAAGHNDPIGAYAADAGYWSVPNATMDSDADLLIAPMPATQGITDPDDPRIAERHQVLDRHEAGHITLKQAATEMGVSATWARYLRDARRTGAPTPLVSAKRCSNASPAKTARPATPNAGSPPSRPSATSRPTSSSAASLAAASRPP